MKRILKIFLFLQILSAFGTRDSHAGPSDGDSAVDPLQKLVQKIDLDRNGGGPTDIPMVNRILNEGSSFYNTFDPSTLTNDELLAMYDQLYIFDRINPSYQGVLATFEKAVKETAYTRLKGDSKLLLNTRLPLLVSNARVLELIKKQTAGLTDPKAMEDLLKRINAAPLARSWSADIPGIQSEIKNLHSWVTPVADILDLFGHADPKKATSLLSQKFALARDSAEALKNARDLQAALKHYNYEDVMRLNVQAIMHSTPLDVAKHHKELAEIAASVVSTDADFVKSLSRDSSPGHLAELVVQAHDSGISPDGPFGTAVGRLLKDRGYASDPSLKYEDLKKYQNWLVGTMSGPDQFVQLANLKTRYEDTLANDFLHANMDRFVKMNPTIDMLMGIQTSHLSDQWAIEKVAKMLPLVKTPDDFLKLLAGFTRGNRHDIGSAVNEMIRKQPDLLAKVTPSSTQQLRELKALEVLDVNNLMAMQTKMLEEIKTADEFIRLTEAEQLQGLVQPWIYSDRVELDQRDRRAFNAQDAFARKHFDKFIGTKPTFDQYLVLASSRSLADSPDEARKIQEKMLPFVKTPEDLTKLMWNKGAKDGRYSGSFHDSLTNSLEYHYSTRSKSDRGFLKDHMLEISNLNPTKAQIRQLEDAADLIRGEIWDDPIILSYRQMPAGRKACPTLFGRIQKLLGS